MGGGHNSANEKSLYLELSISSSELLAYNSSFQVHKRVFLCVASLDLCKQGSPLGMSIITALFLFLNKSICWRNIWRSICLRSTAASLSSRCSLAEQRTGQELKRQDHQRRLCGLSTAQRPQLRGEWDGNPVSLLICEPWHNAEEEAPDHPVG